MNLPEIPSTHSMLCLSIREGEYAEVWSGDKSVKFCVRKSCSGRISLVVIAPREWPVTRGQAKTKGK